MMFIEDLSIWGRRLVFDTMKYLLSMCLVACLLVIVLPVVIDPDSPRYRDIDSSKNKPVPTSVNQMAKELAKQVTDTKIRLLFRTHAHLADRLGVPASDIILESVQDKTWKDTSLECISSMFPGINPITLTPKLQNVNGWKIVYKFKNIRYEYHTSHRGDWILCSKIEIPGDV